MAVGTNFSSFFEKLKLVEEDPLILPPKTWESIPSQNAPTSSPYFPPQQPPPPPLLHHSSLSEESLVRLALNALQGLESALISIEKISAVFNSDPADRTYHTIPGLWNRSTSTRALGKFITSIARSGFLIHLLLKFVDYFKNFSFDVHLDAESSYSLVNQAFGVAVGKVLEGYMSALGTVYASVGLRRSAKSGGGGDHEKGRVSCFTSVVHSEVTVLEVYLHTKELRTRVEALGNVCNVQSLALCFSESSFEELTTKASLEFCNFYRGGDLLTYLYTQLQVADPAHCALLKFLFIHSCEPYCGFIRSWIYGAEISDPYKEFVVEYAGNRPPHPERKGGIPIDFPLASIRDGVAVPCFLKDFSTPIVRAGQQLQVLKKLLELCNYVGPEEYTCEDLLPSWWEYLSNHLFSASPIAFNKGYLEAMAIARNNYYENMLEKINNLSSKLEFRHRQVVPHGAISIAFDNGEESPKNAVSHMFVDRTADNTDFDDSCTDEEFNVLGTSECSSLSGSEEQTEAEQLIEPVNSSVGDEQRYLSSLRFSMSCPSDSALKKPTRSEMSLDIKSDLHKNSEENDFVGRFIHFYGNKRTSSHVFLPPGSEESNSSCMFDNIDSVTGKCWQFGPPKNSLYNDKEHSFYQRSDHCDSAQEASKTNRGFLKEGLPYFTNMISTKDVLMERASGADQLENRNSDSSFFSLQPCKVNFHHDILSRNPMLRKNARFHLVTTPREKCSTAYGQSLPCFDFSTVENLCNISVEKFAASFRHEFGPQVPLQTALATSDKSRDKDKQGCGGESVLIDDARACVSDSLVHLKEQDKGDVVSTNGCGGSSWQSMLGSFSYTKNESVGDHRESLSAIFEIPLDFVIDKCLLQEILLQYKYVSRLTIKLLEEGFDMKGHLLAMRRYYFMESADWAVLFIMSLWHHKWCVAEAEQRVSEIQRFLELSVQRSSCAQDPNKDRLFVYIKENGTMPLSTSAIGVHSFDFLGLGYRVDWPVSIVLTPNGLKIYAQIFSFLIQVKLAVFSLTEVWRTLKNMMHLVTRNHDSAIQEREVRHFNMLIKMRHQVNHFISTLQQYVHSQLSHVSWCKFLHSLKYKVKDIMDLEPVHMAYLTDSLHICFLSKETRSVAIIIESILQCAFDFRSCFTGGMWDMGRDQGDLLGKLSRINISQVLAIKQKFDKNLKQLHICYLKSPKHGEFGLSRFWGYLNYNKYYSDVGNEMNLYAL